MFVDFLKTLDQKLVLATVVILGVGVARATGYDLGPGVNELSAAALALLLGYFKRA